MRAKVLVPRREQIGCVLRNSMLVWPENFQRYIEEAGQPVAPTGGYQSQVLFSGIGSQAHTHLCPNGDATRGGRASLGCDAMAVDPMDNPTKEALFDFILKILDMLRAAGYELVWVDFGKYSAHMYGGDYHFRVNYLRRLTYHGGMSAGTAHPPKRYSEYGKLITYMPTTFRREDMRRNDVLAGEEDHDFDFSIAMFDVERRALGMEKTLKAVGWGAPCGRNLQRREGYRTGGVCVNDDDHDRRGEQYIVYMLVKVKRAG